MIIFVPVVFRKGIACRKTGLSDKCLPKDIFRRYCCKTFHRKYFCFTHPFRKLAESIKQPVSFTRITNIVASTGVKISKNTVINYMEYAKDACLLIPIQNIADKLVERETNPKYYFADNGILNLLLLDADTSLLENLVAVTLLRRYGTDDAVFFYNRNVEVDFYLPDTGVAIQVCYAMNLSDETFQREVQALVKLNKVFECRQLLIITYDDEERIELEKCAIEVIPVWKWLLGK